MIYLLVLKQLYDLCDDQVVEGWIENPYWQFLSGERELHWSAPVASTELTHFRNRIGKKGDERLLKLSVDIFHPKIKQEEVVVDTTVQEKNISFPTDAKLSSKIIDNCRKMAGKGNIHLPRGFSRTAPPQRRQVSNRKTPRQKKKP